MLPSLGFQEIVLLGILALVVVGPKDLPLLLRKLGQWTAKLRAMAQEFRTGFDELARQAELDELKKEVDALRRNQVFSDLRSEIAKPLADINKPLDPPAAPLPQPHDVTHAAKDAPLPMSPEEIAAEPAAPPALPDATDAHDDEPSPAQVARSAT